MRSARKWSLQDAKAHFSEVVRLSLDGKPQLVTRNGEDAVIIVSARDYPVARTREDISLGTFLKHSPLANVDLDLRRNTDPGRRVRL